MPARPHRTVDRVTGILETVSLSPRGVTLAELAVALDAAKSSIQELTNGLLARGYLTEEDRRFHLGPGPFILACPRQQARRAVIGPPVRRRAEQRSSDATSSSASGSATPSSSPTTRVRSHRASRTSPAPTPAVPSTRARLARPCSPTSPTTRCTASSTSPRPSRQATCGSSSPSSPRSARAGSRSTGGRPSPTRTSWRRPCWHPTARSSRRSAPPSIRQKRIVSTSSVKSSRTPSRRSLPDMSR